MKLLRALRYFWNDFRYYRALAEGKLDPDQKANLRVLHRDYTWVREDQQRNRWVCLMCNQSDVAQPVNLLARNRFVIQHSHCGFKTGATMLPGILMHPREVYSKLLAKWEDQYRAGRLSQAEFLGMVEATAMLTGQETPQQERQRIAQQRLSSTQKKFGWRDHLNYFLHAWGFGEYGNSRSWTAVYSTPWLELTISHRSPCPDKYLYETGVRLLCKPGPFWRRTELGRCWHIVFSTMRVEIPDLNREKYALRSAC